MEKSRKTEFSSFKDFESQGHGVRLWCGKIQDLCDGSICPTCHMFPVNTASSSSILSKPSLTDLERSSTLTDSEE